MNDDKKRKKKQEKNDDYYENDKRYKSPSKSNRNISKININTDDSYKSDRNHRSRRRKEKKKVSFSAKVIVTDVECWKQYNLEQNSKDDIDALIKYSSSYQNKKGRDPNVKCTCLIF